MNALVIYQSKNGTTRRMAEEIAAELKNNQVDVKIGSIREINPNDIENADHLYLGCWTSGMLLFAQKPDKEWRKFVGKIPVGLRKKTTMFTTYKIATGSMFKEMRNKLTYRGLTISNNALKSKTGALNPVQRKIICQSLN